MLWVEPGGPSLTAWLPAGRLGSNDIIDFRMLFFIQNITEIWNSSMRSSIRSRTVELATADGLSTTAYVTEPATAGPHPAIVFGAEATGLNTFIRNVADRMAEAGYVTITPDYYRGAGPKDPENYTDFTDVFAAISDLDFRSATHDILSATDWLRDHPQVDAKKVAVWGYCTGGTLTMMAACLDRRLAAAILFYPSQARFEKLTGRRPSHPMDLVWNIACPTLLVCGDNDHVLPLDLVTEIQRRLSQWDIPHQVEIYAGAGHAFSCPSPTLYNAAAAAGSWRAAITFISTHLPAAKDARS